MAIGSVAALMGLDEAVEEGVETWPNGRSFPQIIRNITATVRPTASSRRASPSGKDLSRADELREEMKQASQEIAKDPMRMRETEREGFAPQVRNFVRQAEREHGLEKGRDLGKDRDFDMER